MIHTLCSMTGNLQNTDTATKEVADKKGNANNKKHQTQKSPLPHTIFSTAIHKTICCALRYFIVFFKKGIEVE